MSYESKETKRILWILLVTGACLGFVVQLSCLLIEYMKYPVTLTTLSSGTRFIFPDITVCILGDYPSDLLKDSDIPGKLSNLKTRMIRHYLMASFGGVQRHTYMQRLHRLMKSVRFSSMNLSEIRMPQNDFFIWCRYKDKSCEFKSIVESFHAPEFSGCFTFRLNSNPIKGIEDIDPFTLILFIPEENADKEDRNMREVLEKSRGVSVTVHTPNSFPYPGENSVDVSPGYSTTLRLSMVQKVKKQTPKQPCQSSKTISEFRDLTSDQIRAYGYCQKDRFSIHYQNFLWKSCGCVSHVIPLPSRFQRLDLCLYFDFSVNHPSDQILEQFIKRAECHGKFMANLSNSWGGSDQNMLPACHTYDYHKTVSVMSWPLINNYHAIWTKLRHKFLQETHQGNVSLLKAFNSSFQLNRSQILTNSIIKLEIIPDSLNANLEKENLVYSWDKLLSDIGGSLGLWIGVSILSICDFLEFLLKTGRRVSNKIKGVNSDENLVGKDFDGDKRQDSNYESVNE